MWKGNLSSGGNQPQIPDDAIIQFHSHPPDLAIGLDKLENTEQDYASKCGCTDPRFYDDIERWASNKYNNVTGAVVFGPTGAYAYDLRSMTMNTQQIGTNVLSYTWQENH
jgi:hypothetical protein